MDFKGQINARVVIGVQYWCPTAAQFGKSSFNQALGALTNEFVAPVDRSPAAIYPQMVERNPVDIPPEQLKFIQDHGSSVLTEAFYDDQVRITDDGLVGWGEGKNAAGSAGQYAALVHLLNVEVAPQLIGWNPGDITAI